MTYKPLFNTYFIYQYDINSASADSLSVLQISCGKQHKRVSAI